MSMPGARDGAGVGRALYIERLFVLLQCQGFHAAFAGIALPNGASVALHEGGTGSLSRLAYIRKSASSRGSGTMSAGGG